jgi:ribosome-binding factor A
MASKRTLQIGESIREHIAMMLVRGEISDPRVRNVTINAVKVSPDLQLARVYYSVLGDEKLRAGVQQGLKNAAGYLRKSLGETLGLRYTPNLTFFYDESIQRAARMGELFAGIERERREVEAAHSSSDEGGAAPIAGVAEDSDDESDASLADDSDLLDDESEGESARIGRVSGVVPAKEQSPSA